MPKKTPEPVKEEKTYTRNQLWGAMTSAWKAYRVARVQEDVKAQIKYAKRIKSCQQQLLDGGVEYDVKKIGKVLDFPELEKMKEWDQVSAD